MMVPLKMIRQRYVLADQAFTLSSMEVESPQLSRAAPGPSPLSFCTSTHDVAYAALAPSDHHRLMWRHRAEDLLWLASAFFILYYGDFRSNFFSLLATDPRVLRYMLGLITCAYMMGLEIKCGCVCLMGLISRAPLHIGSACLILDCCIILYIAIRMQTHEERLELVAPGVLQAATMVGLMAFILTSIALWPIWNFLTVPMLFTLFMAFMVVAPYLLSPSYLYIRSSRELGTW